MMKLDVSPHPQQQLGAVFMRTVRRFSSFRISRKPIVTLGLFALILLLASGAAAAILANDLVSLAVAGMVFAGVLLVMAILNDWRRGFYVFVIWILFEDFIRKYLGNNMVIYFIKDALVIIVYLSFYRARRASKIEKLTIPFRVPLLLFFWLCVLQMFNPNSPSIFYGLMGMKMNFLYIPLIYVGYAFLESEEDVERLFSLLSLAILIVAALGLAQSIVGPSFLNPANLQDDIRGLSTLYREAGPGIRAYRPPSVFVSAGRFQDFLLLAWILSLGRGAYLVLRKRRGQWLAFTTIGVVAAVSVMSASRGVFMWNAGTALITVAGFVWGTPWRQRASVRMMKAIRNTALFAGVAIALLITLFPQEIGSRLTIYSATLLPDSPSSELVLRTQTYPLQQIENAFEHTGWLFGYGIGTSGLGVQYVIRIIGAQPPVAGVEGALGNMLLELGIVGLVLYIALGISIAVSAWKIAKQLRGSAWFPLAFAISLYAALLLIPMTYIGGTSYYDFVLNAYLWVLLGVLFRLKDFPKDLQVARGETLSGTC